MTYGGIHPRSFEIGPEIAGPISGPSYTLQDETGGGCVRGNPHFLIFLH